MKRAIVIFTAVLVLAGCGRAARAPVDAGIGLEDRLQAVGPTDAAPGESGSFIRHRQVMRGGVLLDAVALIAPVSVQADPGEFAGKFALCFRVAPVFNLGDGMQLSVMLVDGDKRVPLFERYFDAGRVAADRKWTNVRIPIDFDGSRARLEFRVSGGPQGDLVMDWLALAELRLERTP